MSIRNLGLAVVCLFFIAPVHGSEPNEHFHDALWVAESHGVLKIAAAGGDIDLVIDSAEKVRAVAIDPVGALVWVARTDHLTAHAFDGEVQHSIELDSGNASSGSPVLSVDRRDGSVWLARGQMLEIFAFDGSPIASSQLSDEVVAMALGESAGTRWIASHRQVGLRNEHGDVLDAWAAASGEQIRDIALHLTEGGLWLLSNQRVYLYDSADQGIVWQRDERHLERIRLLDEESAWLAGSQRTVLVDLQGGVAGGFEYAQPGNLVDFAVDPLDGSLWIASQQYLERYGSDGTLIDEYAFSSSDHEGRLWSLALYVDDIPPSLAIVDPVPGTLTNNSLYPFELQYEDTGIGVDPETLEFSINDTPAPFDCEQLDETGSRCLPVHALPEGGNHVEATVSDYNMNVSEPASVDLVVDTIPPEFLALSPENGTVVSESPITVSGQLSEPAVLEINGNGVAQDAELWFAEDVALSVGSNTVDLIAVDPAGNATHQELSVELEQSTGLPPDPEDVAPDLPEVGSPTFHDRHEFLYSGSDPIQRDVEPGIIEADRFSILRGSVKTRANEPLSGVRIRVLGQSELGHTLSRTDGRFDLAVNGGGNVTLVYEKEGYFPVQRRIATGWNDWYHAHEVVMIQPDDKVTAIDLTDTSQPFQVARNNPTEDADGQRQVTLLFPAGTTAKLTMPDGSEEMLDQLDVRATEYTVGTDGPAAMPAPLPPASGYTYAVELSVDQVLERGFLSNGRDIQFNQPVPFYVDNFLEFPAGEPVPTGFLDQTVGNWIPYENGRVIDVLAVEDGHAVLDVTGSGVESSAAEVEELGISVAERVQLAEIYQAGDSLWRVALDHFSSWDCNWPYGPPDDAEEPNLDLPKTDAEDEPEDSSEEDCHEGCVINPQTQALGEQLQIAGTPYSLHYQSSRAKGYGSGSTLAIPLTDEDLPESLLEIELTIDVAGQRLSKKFPADPGQQFNFAWDGHDGFGQPVHGNVDASIAIHYVYPCVYYGTDADNNFGEFGDIANAIGSRDDCEGFRMSQRSSVSLKSPLALPVAVGNWGLSVDHFLLENAGELTRGDGSRRKLSIGIIETIAGNGTAGFSGDGGPAIDASIQLPDEVSVSQDGSVYVATGYRIRRIDPDGVITTVAGTGTRGFSGDGGLATDAEISQVEGLAHGADGSLYISDKGNRRVRRVDPNGIITTVAGIGWGYGGDGGPATEAFLFPFGIALGPDDSLYIAELYDHRVRRVGPDGMINTVAGTGRSGFSGDGGLATEAKIGYPIDLALGGDGSLYISTPNPNHSLIRRVRPDGIITTVAGTGSSGFSGDGGPAVLAQLSHQGIAVAADDSLFIADRNNERIRKVSQDGIITTVAGAGDRGFSGDGGPAVEARTNRPQRLATFPDGSFVFPEPLNYRIRRVSPRGVSFESSGARRLSSRDGSQVYIFDASGRHLRTDSAHTGKVLQTFSRDEAGRLLEIADADGNATRIVRNTDGHATAIIAPDGQRTDVEVDDHGHLVALQSPTGDRWSMSYTDDGLLTRFETPNGHANQFQYDSDGRLLRDIDPNGGGWTLSRTDLDEGYQVDMTSGEGRIYSYFTRRDFNGNRHYQRIAPDGTLTSRQHSASGMTLERPDGTRIEVTETPDPRFGMESPVPAQTSVALPSGKTLQAMVNRTVELGDDDGLNVLMERVTVNDRETEIHYDAAERQWTTTGPTGRQSVRLTDEVGRPVSLLVDGLAPIHMAYDGRGRPASITQGSGDSARSVTFAYQATGDAAGYLATVTDPLGREVHYEQDAAGRVTEQTLPDGRTIGYAYDGVGNLIALTPPGRSAHLFEYDGLDQRTTYVPPELDEGWTVTRYRYNLDRQLTEIERPDGEMVTFTYGDGGRLIRRTADAGAVDYGYDAATGQLISMNAPGNIGLSFEYDGPLAIAEEWSGPIQGRIGRTYDNNFWLTGESVDGHTIAFDYDDDGLLTSAGSLALTRDPAHGLIVSTAFDGITGSRSYNDFGELTSRQILVDDADTYTVSYSRDALGRIETRSETTGGVTVENTYHYDQAGRLIQVDENGVTAHSYSYDANSNRIEHTGPGGTVDADYDEQDRMTRYGDSFYSYNAAGDLTEKDGPEGITTYDYDAAGNLRAVTLPDGTEIEYLIDGRDRRVGKKVDGVLQKSWIYRDQLSPVAQFDGDGNLTHRFVYAEKAHSPSWMVRINPATGEETTYRIISDHLGSVRLIIEVETGAIAQQLEYGPFGKILYDSNSGFQPFGIAGGLSDQHTGLVRFGARDYDPELGRWASRDPIDFAGGQANLYLYVQGDPVSFFDPWGLSGTSLVTAEVSLGLQAGISPRFGPFDATISGDLGSYRLSSNSNRTTVTQGYQITAGAFDWEFGWQTQRSAPLKDL